MNLYQFCSSFEFWVTSEVTDEQGVEVSAPPKAPPSDEWLEVLENTMASLRPFVEQLAASGIPVPTVEHFSEDIEDDAFAELAWPDLSPPVAVLAGDQAALGSLWEGSGWKVVELEELQAKGAKWLIGIVNECGHGVA
jgi:DEAD/DEAH box helicase domain-containing protein